MSFRHAPLFLPLVWACVQEPVEIRIKGPREAVESTQANPSFATFENKDDTLQLRASAFSDKGKFMGVAKVAWDSSDRTVATVNQAGLVTILGTGKTTISARTTETKTPLEAKLDISALIVDGIRIVEPQPTGTEPIQIHMGETIQFKAEVLDDRGEVIPNAKIEWNSSSFAATVTPQGEVEGRAMDNTTISATAKNGKSVRWDVQVNDWKPEPKKKKKK